LGVRIVIVSGNRGDWQEPQYGATRPSSIDRGVGRDLLFESDGRIGADGVGRCAADISRCEKQTARLIAGR
jgi:hypothetical protein